MGLRLMCGISGIVRRGLVDSAEIAALIQGVIHRGPDGIGHWVSDDARTGLGH